MSPILQYHDVSLEFQVTLTQNGQSHEVPIHGGESFEHAMYKVSIAAHLLKWGYRWQQIHWEETPKQWPGRDRPDLYAEGNASLPWFWFECKGTDNEKLSKLAEGLPRFRVIHVVDCDWSLRLWNGEETFSSISEMPIKDIKDAKERKRLVLLQRESMIPRLTEHWLMSVREKVPRILYAMRRGNDGRFTYLDSGEGYSLSGIQYMSKIKDGIEPLIPGIAGRVGWSGKAYVS